MIKVAITGNIASGKSQVEKILQGKGYLVFDADKIAHEILETSQELKKHFFQFDILENDRISRKKLGNLVFNNSNLLKELNDIIHPLVKNKILEIFKKYANEKYIFISIPLLFESNMQDLFDKIILVYCNDDLRLERLIKRNNFDIDTAQKRIKAQDKQELKINKSDIIIKNESTLENLKNEINKYF